MMWELFNEPFDIRPDGMVHAPDQPGLGFTLRANALERFRYVDGPEYVDGLGRCRMSMRRACLLPTHPTLFGSGFASLGSVGAAYGETPSTPKMRCVAYLSPTAMASLSGAELYNACNLSKLSNCTTTTRGAGAAPS
jgi:hypothetical protein